MAPRDVGGCGAVPAHASSCHLATEAAPTHVPDGLPRAIPPVLLTWNCRSSR